MSALPRYRQLTVVPSTTVGAASPESAVVSAAPAAPASILGVSLPPTRNKPPREGVQDASGPPAKRSAHFPTTDLRGDEKRGRRGGDAGSSGDHDDVSALPQECLTPPGMGEGEGDSYDADGDSEGSRGEGLGGTGVDGDYEVEVTGGGNLTHELAPDEYAMVRPSVSRTVCRIVVSFQAKSCRVLTLTMM